MAPSSAAGVAAVDSGCGQRYRQVFHELCHMVALSRTGKATKVTEALVERAIVLTRPAPGDPASVSAAILDRFGISTSTQDVQRAIEVFVQDGRLRRVNGHYQLGQAERTRVLREIETSRELEGRVRERWLEETIARSEQLSEGHGESLWRCLRCYMERVFQEHGALSAELLQAGSAEPAVEDGLAQHASRAMAEASLPAVLHPDVIAAIHAFFDSDDADRNEYIAQHLDATFTIFALSTPEAAATYLRDQMPQLTLFLDTNFIFELLDLHVSEYDVSKDLVSFIRDNSLPIDLVYHPRTLREVRDTLAAIGEGLRARNWSQSLSRATLTTGTASGVELKYHALNAENPVSPDVFMRRYEDHVTELLTELGVRLLRTKSEPFSDEDKALLVMEYKAFVEQLRPNKEKQYGTLEHDALLLLSLQQHRNDSHSALHSGALFLTNDRVLQRFDWDEFRGASAPSVVLPQALFQVLRPFGTTSGETNRNFVRAFGVPELRTAHNDYGETTRELRSHLATYQDLAEETAVGILGNELLRTRLEAVTDAEQFEAIVENEVVRLNTQLLGEREELRVENEERESRIDQLETELANKDVQLTEVHDRANGLASELETVRAQATQASGEVAELNATLETLRQDVDRRVQEAEDRRVAEQARRTAFRRRAVAIIGCLVTIAVGAAILVNVPWLHGHDRRVGIAASFVLLAACGWGSWERRSWKVAAMSVFPALVALVQIL